MRLPYEGDATADVVFAVEVRFGTHEIAVGGQVKVWG